MLGYKSGFKAHVTAVAPNMTFVHCFIHRLALCSKVLPQNMLSCLNQVIKLINFVKTSALNIQLFKQLCEDLNSNHTCLLYYTEVRWLSRGNATKRLFELRDELLKLFKAKKSQFSKRPGEQKFFNKIGISIGHFRSSEQLQPVVSRTQSNCNRVHFEAESTHS